VGRWMGYKDANRFVLCHPEPLSLLLVGLKSATDRI
jgi:hypothetical protein